MNDISPVSAVVSIIQFATFIGCFRMIYVLSKSFMSPALESMALRFGWSSEIIASVIIRMSLCAPEMGISFTETLAVSGSSFGNLALRVILGSGGITFLLLPVLVAFRGGVTVSIGLIFREICMYAIAVGSLYHMVVGTSHPVFWFSILIGSFSVYIAMLCYSQHLSQVKRRQDRQSLLMYRLVPFGAIVDAPPHQVIEPFSYAPSRDEVFSVTEKILERVCLQALPGFPSERYALPSLLNVFVLQLLFSGLIAWIAKGWISNEIPIIALLAQSTDIVGIMAGTHTLVCSLSSQNFAVFIGLGVPWLMRYIVHGPTVTSGASAVYNSFKLAALGSAIFLVYTLFNTKEKMVHFDKFNIEMFGFTASTMLTLQTCTPNSAFFGFMGVTAAIVFANLGSAYGTAKAGVGISSMGVMRPDLVMRSIIPVVMAGILGIYGLITAVIINGKLDKPATYSQYSGYAHLGAGLTVGLSSLAAGLAIGIVGDAGVRANAQQPKLFVGMILILIFAEALALYGLIVGLVVASTADKGNGLCASYA